MYILDDFKEITGDAIPHKLVPQGQLYFGTLIAALDYVDNSTKT